MEVHLVSDKRVLVQFYNSNENITITVEPIWGQNMKPTTNEIKVTGDQTQSNAAAAAPETAAAAVSSDPVDSTQSESASDAE